MTKASGSEEQLEMAKILAGNSGDALKWLRSRLGLKLEQVGQLGIFLLKDFPLIAI